MIVRSSSISLMSKSTLETAERVTVARRATSTGPATSTGAAPTMPPPPRVMASEGPAQSHATKRSDAVSEDEDGLDPRLAAMKRIIERLMGGRLRTLRRSDLRPTDQATAPGQRLVSLLAPAGTPPSPNPTGPGLSFEHSFHESQTLEFQAQGLVKTEDGREIAIDMRSFVSRDFAEKLTLTTGPQAQDPLVLNVPGLGTADLTSSTFAFDLDGDGGLENIHALAEGSMFLAFDGNGDGRISDGTELFGPATGSGMGELSRLDLNGSGWIDEGDSAFSKLGLWSASGGAFIPLTKAGVGAISTSSVAAPLILRDGNGDIVGLARRAGIYLMQDGQAGSVQELDLVVD